MGKYHIRIVGGWCGNRMVIVRDHLAKLLDESGYITKIDQQSIWENYAPPDHADMVLQLIPAFNSEELNSPSLNIRPFLKDIHHIETLEAIFKALGEHYPAATNQPAGVNPFAVQAG
jgi:hypothetical protein